MTFRVAARTVLELGAELISSDAVAIYELVKNAIDARSKDGVTIEFSIALQHSDYVDALARAVEVRRRSATVDHSHDAVAELADLRLFIAERLLPQSPRAAREAIVAALEKARTLAEFSEALESVYAAYNWIEFRDTGSGMSRDDIVNAYLVIGTPIRRRQMDRTLADGSNRVPLGEKGIGRLSAMRLGSRLHIDTATMSDRRFNVLDIDWDSFDDLDKLISDIPVEPIVGERKPAPEFSGTTIRISNVQSTWSPRRIRESVKELARLSDPFTKSKRRFRIVTIFNGERLDIPRLDRELLDHAHARAIGTYTISDGKAELEANLWCGNLGGGNAPEERRLFLEYADLRGVTADADVEIPSSALRTVGPFSFELYWYNRRILAGIDSIGDRARVKDLQKQWAGIMLFRDGYRVFPYGDETDDWLGLDRLALGSGGYKLNKLQFIGRVNISRAANPELIDQTSREGLKECPEKDVLVETLGYVIQNRLRGLLNEIEERQRHVDLDFDSTAKRVQTLEKRAKHSIRVLQQRYANERPNLQELLEYIEEMQSYFERAKARAEEIEDERDRMIHLAGIGLMLEVVAHELARSTEHTLRMLDDAASERLPADVASLFGALRDEMKTMNKRLRVLDPLSVSGRQRKEKFGLAALVREVFAGHAAQFERHHVTYEIKVAVGRDELNLHAVRGMFVQVIENLVQNSIYWMDLRREDEDDYKPHIEVTIGPAPVVMAFTDNGPGIQPTLREEIFKPFFSTKGKHRRQGLGLFIARDCVEYHGGQIYLSDERRAHRGRLNTFIIELPVALIS